MLLFTHSFTLTQNTNACEIPFTSTHSWEQNDELNTYTHMHAHCGLVERTELLPANSTELAGHLDTWCLQDSFSPG